jgi:hypothetical protein
MQHHKYNLADLENMIPWERELYVMQLEHYIKETNDRLERQKQQYG